MNRIDYRTILLLVIAVLAAVFGLMNDPKPASSFQSPMATPVSPIPTPTATAECDQWTDPSDDDACVIIGVPYFPEEPTPTATPDRGLDGDGDTAPGDIPEPFCFGIGHWGWEICIPRW